MRTATPEERARQRLPHQLRVLTYNIRHGQGMDGQLDLERVATIIRRLDPDLVALQEVDRGTRRAGGVDQPVELGRLTGLHAIFGIAMNFDDGQYGETVLSRHPVTTSKVHPLPCGTNSEPRCALEVHVSWPMGANLIFIATHLDQLDAPTNRIAQARAMVKLCARNDQTPMILAGDMNAQPDSQPIRILTETWFDTGLGHVLHTFPAADPKEQIDHVFVKPAAWWRVLEIRTIEEKVASDHYPLFVVLESRFGN